MTLQNRVTPEGEIVAHPGRGLFMGNRGILHDAKGEIVRSHAHRAWITCLLHFKDRPPPTPLVQPGRYTRLFFLDEAVALAAGHRPCAECRRTAYDLFRAAWAAAAGSTPPLARDMDSTLHASRIMARRGSKVTFSTDPAALPDFTFVRTAAGPGMVLGTQLLPYTPGGYGPPLPRPRDGSVEVLTPRPIVAALQAGYRPDLHPTAVHPAPIRAMLSPCPARDKR